MHPFHPLTPEEITLAVSHVRKHFPQRQLYFRVVTLSEPSKRSIADSAQQNGTEDQKVRRQAKVQLYLDERISRNFVQLRLKLEDGHIIEEKLLEGRHSHVDADDLQHCERVCMSDPKVQAAIAELDLPDEAQVVVEPWTYATDGIYDMKDKITMCYFYMRLASHKDANYYAYPLTFAIELSKDFEVLQLLQLPLSDEAEDSVKFRKFDRRKIHHSSEYHSDLTVEPRTTTSPYLISQPNGPSFKVADNHLTWEKWSVHVGFNYREGMTLHDIRFDDQSLFHRISLAEMFVPYGDSRMPYGRKAAFDLGNDGAGANCNNLQLGCDCLGHIQYLDGWLVTSNGEPLKMPNVMCCHEIDDGILWKHTNYRTQNPVVARSRVLILQTVVTVTNYKYVFAFHFRQDASIHYEVRATGILSTVPIQLGEKSSFGTIVAPGVMAPNHQHLFSLRIDPAIGGNKNSIMVEETHPIPLNIPEMNNSLGIGFTTQSKPIEREIGLDLDLSVNRVFKIVNENVINPTTGTPIGYKIAPHPSQMLLAHPSSYHAKRSEFAAHAFWVTKFHDDEFFPAGDFTMQSMGGEGIASWIKARENTADSNVRNEDIVLWHTFGSTHIPRIEDWPVMPCEKMTVGLKPVNFFATGNPAMDVAVAQQGELNGSVLVSDTTNGHCDGGE